MQSKNKVINVLIISYFFQPDKVVGALRTSYWYKKFLQEPNFEIEVITANKESKSNDIFVVEQSHQFKWYHFVKDLGLLWLKDLKVFFLSNAKVKKPDVVIISGSPFLHFSIGRILKKKYNCKVVLDYRDPFSDNPGFKTSRFKKWIKLLFEFNFNRSADGFITVNNYCAHLIQGFFTKKNIIIQNGYDESIQPILKPVNTVDLSFCYTGKFYFDPNPMVDAFNTLGVSLVYVGPSLIKSSNSFDNRGFVSYNEAVNIIANSDVGIIQTYGEDFQSTTKIFDYIRCKKIILIVSDLYLEQGSIHEELKEYPNVFWVKNDSKSILEGVKKIQASTYISPSKEFEVKYSRKYQFDKLVKFIQEFNV